MTNQQLKFKARQTIVENSGALTGATFIYGAIYVLVTGVILYAYSMSLFSKGVFNSLESMEMYIETTSSNYGYSLIVEGVSVLIRALMSTILVGLQFMCISNIRGQEIKASDVFFAIKRNPDKVIILALIKALLSFVFAIPVNVMALMSDKLGDSIVMDVIYFAFLVVSYACDVIVAVLMSQSMFEYIENPDGTIISYVENSMSLMKNNAGRYILLYLSFIPINIVAIFTMGLMYLWVLPYMWTAFALFYLDIKGEHEQRNTIDVTI